jgi:hypothetical protein
VKTIGYGKIGRSMPLTLEKCGNLGGDVEMVAVVKEMALRNPDDHFLLVGRNTGERPQDVGLPDNVFNPWILWAPLLRDFMKSAGIKGSMSISQHIQLREFMHNLTDATFRRLDGIVMWVGQHGSTNTPIPMTDGSGRLTKPHDSYAYYASFLLQGINTWRDQDPFTLEEVYLNADARNRHKMRDLKWPLNEPILTQYNFQNKIKHERYGDESHFTEFARMREDITAVDRTDGTWRSTVGNIYSRLEINGLAPGTPFGDLISFDSNWDRPGDFGLFINEARSIGINERRRRVNVMAEWVLPLDPYFVHGTWSEESQKQLNRVIFPAPWSEYYPRLQSVRCTFTTPSSGSGWATAKPWEAFAGGTVCFFHPDYDDQDNILYDAPKELREWLRVKDPEELKRRVKHLSTDENAWRWIIGHQRAHFDRAMSEKRYMKMIEERIYG